MGDNIIMFEISFKFLSELNNLLHMKNLKRSTFYVKLIDNRVKKLYFYEA